MSFMGCSFNKLGIAIRLTMQKTLQLTQNISFLVGQNSLLMNLIKYCLKEITSKFFLKIY